MKAAVRPYWTSFGVDFLEDYPVPAAPTHPDKILVRVHAAALNPVDYKAPRLIFGKVFGMDVCGTIVALPPNCKNPDLKVGDVILGLPTLGFAGGLSEYTVCYASKVVKLPRGWTVEEGAAMPVACSTAMDGFRQAGVLDVYQKNPEKPPISSILVIGASGGCGIVALQLAKGMGIPTIVGICSAKNADLCRANGATQVVPYDDPTALEKFLDDTKGQIEMIYDTASYGGAGALFGADEDPYCYNPKVVALLPETSRHSRYIQLNGSMRTKVHAVTLGLVHSRQRSLIVLPNFSGMQLGMELMEKANMKPIIDNQHEFSKEGVTQAYKELKSRRAKGKIVISISKKEDSK